MWWERFSSESETLSSWIYEKEKELEAINAASSLDPLDKNISTVEVLYLMFLLLFQNFIPCLVFGVFSPQ